MHQRRGVENEHRGEHDNHRQSHQHAHGGIRSRHRGIRSAAPAPARASGVLAGPPHRCVQAAARSARQVRLVLQPDRQPHQTVADPGGVVRASGAHARVGHGAGCETRLSMPPSDSASVNNSSSFDEAAYGVGAPGDFKTQHRPESRFAVHWRSHARDEREALGNARPSRPDARRGMRRPSRSSFVGFRRG